MSGLRQDRAGLGRYGVVAPTIVRTPARNPDGTVICPECGAGITGSKSAHRVVTPDLADHDLREALDGELLVYGWRCSRHEYDVVCPVRVRGPDAGSLQEGWTGVRMVYADQSTRWVATPERELPAPVDR